MVMEVIKRRRYNNIIVVTKLTNFVLLKKINLSEKKKMKEGK